MRKDAEPRGEDLKALTYAIAKRGWLENERSKKENVGDRSYTQSSAALMEARTLLVADLIEQAILEPNKIPEIAQEYAIIQITEVVADTNIETNGATEVTQEVIDQSKQDIIDAVPPEVAHRMFTDILMLKDNAVTLSVEIGVKPQEIFENDNLYADLVSRSFSPTQWAQQEVGDFKITSANAFKNAIDLAHTLEIDEITTAEVKAQIIAATEKIAKNRATSLEQEELVRVANDVEYFWGEEGLAALPRELKEKILLAHLYFGKDDQEILGKLY